ncbi:MAG: response regulator [Dehalococcoidales bacterium]|nr:response regulator [Dehalococcoidales bacterium]
MSSQRAGVLVVDDERSVTDLLSTVLKEEGYGCITAATGEEALEKLSMSNVDVALIDLRLPGMPGMDVLRVIKAAYPRTAVIVVTAAGDAETAVQAMKTGAVDYITKPFEVERVSQSIETALQASINRGNKSTPQAENAEISDEEVNWTRCLDAIAEGVETRWNSLTGDVITITVLERTIAVAQSLGIPEDHVKKWADDRRKHMARINILDSLLNRMEQSPAA